MNLHVEFTEEYGVIILPGSDIAVLDFLGLDLEEFYDNYPIKEYGMHTFSVTSNGDEATVTATDSVSGNVVYSTTVSLP